MTQKRILVIAVVALMSFWGMSEANSQVVVKVKPARAKVVVVKPAKPGRNYVWVEGHWKWNKRSRSYTWENGYWARRPRQNSVWVAAKWKKVPGGWKYVPGHWA